MKKILFPILFLPVFLAGCTSPLMNPTFDDSATSASADKAIITFYRPSIFGATVQAPVAHETSKNKLDLTGILSTGVKVRKVVEPGRHVFVVSGENSNLLVANVQANKKYYVRVDPGIGWLKARFYLKPIRKENLNQENYIKQIKDCQLAVINEAGHRWFENNYGSMNGKFIRAVTDYNEEDLKGKGEQTLNPEDGVDELF